MTIEQTIIELKRCQSKEECLRKVYDILASKYHGERIKTYSRIWELLYNSPKKLWKKNGFLHCTNINKLAKYLLLESGLFAKNDVKTKWTQIWLFSPHQYLPVQIEPNKWIDIDIWAKQYGIKFGDHASGFH